MFEHHSVFQMNCDVFSKQILQANIGRGCDYDQYDSFWIFGLLTDKLNVVVKTCDPGSIIEIKDDLTYLDEQ